MSSATQRLRDALLRSYFDRESFGRVTGDEWNDTIAPALESKRDLTPEAVEAVKRAASMWGVDEQAKRAALEWVNTRAQHFFPPRPVKQAIAIQTEGRYPVYLTADGQFTKSADGTPPADLNERGSALFRAGKFIEDNFGKTTLFGQAAITQELKQSAFDQLKEARAHDLSSLDASGKRQYTACIGALLVDLLKSLPNGGTAAGLRGKVFDEIVALINDPTTPPVSRNILIARMQDKDAVAGLTAEQKATNAELLEQIAPRAPLPYNEMKRRAAREGKATLRIVHRCGAGEGFLYGYAEGLLKQGFRAAPGTPEKGPGLYVKTIPASDPKNKWGVPFEITMELEHFRNNMYEGADREEDLWISYGGHSDLGLNKLNSLRNPPEARGFKLFLTDLCAGADGIDAEWQQFPGVQNLTSHSSTYFRTREDPQQGKYAYASEGFEMMMVMIDAAAGQKEWPTIEDELRRKALWYGHPTSNNWLTPNAWRRIFRELDSDNDGISDLLDALPSYDTFDVEADTRRELDLKVPEVQADQISGRRAFQAARALNTHTNYNPMFSSVNGERNLIGASDAFFEAKPGDKEYARFEMVTSPEGESLVSVQLSSALADASTETMRAILFYEYTRFMAANGEIDLEGGEAILMALVFVTATLEFDGVYRDREIFDGIRRLYGIPDELTFAMVNEARRKADTERHNYCGDRQAVSELEAKCKAAGIWERLQAPGAGSPAVEVTGRAVS